MPETPSPNRQSPANAAVAIIRRRSRPGVVVLVSSAILVSPARCQRRRSECDLSRVDGIVGPNGQIWVLRARVGQVGEKGKKSVRKNEKSERPSGSLTCQPAD